MEYLVWYRRVLNIPVINGTRVQLIEPLDRADASAGFKVTVLRSGRMDQMFARKVGCVWGALSRGGVGVGVLRPRPACCGGAQDTPLLRSLPLRQGCCLNR